MKNIFDWGPLGNITDTTSILQEVFIERTYERMFPVERGDVVVDVGASVGPFTCSILPNKPSKVFCVEPSRELLPFLIKNVSQDCVVINKGISHRDGEPSDSKVFCANRATEVPVDTITFQTFIKSNKITTIDFFKTDCEGAEYDIFNAQNLEWVKNNVKKIAGEWHLSTPSQKEKFIQFKNNFLSHFSYEISSLDEVDIKWDIDNKHFIEHYTEVMVFIDNRA